MKRNCLASAPALFLVCVIGAAAAEPAGYKIDPEYMSTSPDGATIVEQYAKTDADGNYTWQFWARRGDKLTLLKPEQQDYAAGFRFTNDSRWLVRMQKTGSGEADLYLYKLGPDGFVAATAKPLSDLAWVYFYSRPDSRKIMKPDFHIDAELLERNRRELSLDRRGLAGQPLHRRHSVGRCVAQQAAWADPIGSRLALPV